MNTLADQKLPISPVLLGLLVAAVTWLLLSRSQLALQQARFELHASQHDIAIQDSLRSTLNFLETLAVFFEASETVEKEEFHIFSASLLELDPALHALGWNPRVLAADREAFEARTSESLQQTYTITERGADGMVPAGVRAEHVAVQYLEPYEGNESALGFDIASEPRRKAAIDRALESGEMSITAPITLVQEQEEALGFLAMRPVPRTAPESFVVAVVRVPDILAAAVDHDTSPLHTALYDETDGDSQLLCAWPAAGLPLAAEKQGLTSVSRFDVGGRRWRLEQTATDAYTQAHRSPVPLIAAIGVGLVVFMLSGYRQIRRREQALIRESKERLELTLDAVTVGAWDWNLLDGTVFYSDSWLHSLGLERSSIRPHIDTWQGLLHPDDHERVEQARSAHLSGREPAFTVRNRLRTASGAHRWNETRGQVVLRADDGTPLRMVGTDSDITAQVRAEAEQQRRSERAHQAQKLEKLGRLAGGIAHDFNNLLTVITSTTDLMLEPKAASPALRDDVTTIRKAAEQAANLTRQMLDYAGQSPQLLAWLELNQLIRDITGLLVASVSKKVRLRYVLADGLPLIRGDATQLRQIILNLTTNAAGALAPGGGTITISTREQHLTAGDLQEPGVFGEPSPGRHLVLSVEDNGCGIPPEQLASIFDPFFTTRAHGRGLGLAVVHGIVRNHSGGTVVRSVPGEGSRFEICLPVPDAQPAAPTAPVQPPAQPPTPGLILVVDDEPMVRRVTCDLLARAGYTTLEAADGQEGVEVFLANVDQIDALVLDMSMPRLNGAEVIQRIHDTHPKTPIVLYSGYSRSGLLQEALRSDAVRFLGKPFRSGALIEAIEAVIASTR